MSINRVSLSGNLTRDPELRSTTSGSQVLSFGIAVNDRRRNAQGEWEDVPNYVDCVVFGARAESLSRFLAKGQKIVLEGKLRWSQWERDGQKRSKLEVIVDNLDFWLSTTLWHTDAHATKCTCCRTNSIYTSSSNWWLSRPSTAGASFGSRASSSRCV